MTFNEYEKEIVRILVRDALPSKLLEEILSATDCDSENTGVGYFVTKHHRELPTKRTVFGNPLVITKRLGIETGYVIFVENETLTFECHAFGDKELSSNYRNERSANGFQKVLVNSGSVDTALAEKTLEYVVNHFPKLVAFVGHNCRELEDVCDAFCERTEQGIGVVTTSHSDETEHEVKEFVEQFSEDDLGKDYLLLKF